MQSEISREKAPTKNAAPPTAREGEGSGGHRRQAPQPHHRWLPRVVSWDTYPPHTPAATNNLPKQRPIGQNPRRNFLQNGGELYYHDTRTGDECRASRGNLSWQSRPFTTVSPRDGRPGLVRARRRGGGGGGGGGRREGKGEQGEGGERGGEVLGH